MTPTPVRPKHSAWCREGRELRNDAGVGLESDLKDLGRSPSNSAVGPRLLRSKSDFFERELDAIKRLFLHGTSDFGLWVRP